MSYYKGSGYGGSRGGGYRGGGGSSSGYRGSTDSAWRGPRGGSSFSSSRPVGSSSSGSSRYYPSSPPSSYESRSRSSYVGGTSSGDRYSSRREESYSRYPEVSSYGSRDYGRGSPDPPRKRVRGESPSYMGGRRSHDRSFTASSGADYTSSRVGGGSGSFYEKGSSSSGTLGGGYLSEKGTYREVRESRAPHHAPPSITTDDYQSFRKPSFSSSRGVSGFRASRRGGLRSSRGAAFRRASSSAYLSRKKLLAESAYHLRRRGLTTRTSYLRKLKQYRLLKRYRALERKKRDEDDGDDAEDEEKDRDVPEGDDDEVIEVGSSQGEEENDDDGDEDDDDDDDDEGAVEGEITTKEKGATKEPVEMEEGEVEGDDDIKGRDTEEGAIECNDEKDSKDKDSKESSKEGSISPKKDIKKKKKDVSKKVVKKSKTSSSSDSKEAKKSDEAKEHSDREDKEDGESKTPLTNFLGQPFINLKCPHCHYSCVTFKEYSRHLESTKHITAMRNLSAKLRKTFATMRLEQRKMQKTLDEEAKSLNMRLRTVFCGICKLNYRTLKSQHQNSASHMKMKEFQSPYCRVCRVGFKSSWTYELHLCELPHIKRKARIERLSHQPGTKDDNEDDINLYSNNFMVLDAVGSGDESEVEKSDNETADGKLEDGKERNKEGSTEKKKKKERKEIKLGSEFCKLLEVYFCELCKIYLPRLDDKEKALTVHCRSRTHLQRYIRCRDDRSLRRKAVKLHKEREKLKEKEKDKKNKDDSKGKEDIEDNGDKKEENSDEKPELKKEAGEKSWSEIDKVVSCLEEDEDDDDEGEKNSDDDEDDEEEKSKEGGRYDRFKHSDQDGNNTLESPESPPAVDNQPIKTKSNNISKETSNMSSETTANGSITSAEKKKMEVSE